MTHGLSTHNAIDLVKIRRIDLATNEVDVVMPCTDGLDFAYEDAGWHDPTMADLLARLPHLDSSRLESELHQWCEPPARIGGDDTRIAMVVQRDLLTVQSPSGVQL